MSKRDTVRTAHKARQAYEWNVDSMPSKATKSHKVKERQVASTAELMKIAHEFMEEYKEMMIKLGDD